MPDSRFPLLVFGFGITGASIITMKVEFAYNFPNDRKSEFTLVD